MSNVLPEYEVKFDYSDYYFAVKIKDFKSFITNNFKIMEDAHCDVINKIDDFLDQLSKAERDFFLTVLGSTIEQSIEDTSKFFKKEIYMLKIDNKSLENKNNELKNRINKLEKIDYLFE